MQRIRCDTCGSPDAVSPPYQYGAVGPGLFVQPTTDSVPQADSFHLCSACMSARIWSVLETFDDVPVMIELAAARSAAAEFKTLRPRLEKKLADSEKKRTVLASRLAGVERDERKIAERAVADARKIAQLEARVRMLEAAAGEKIRAAAEAQEEISAR
jgi:hypothetical protein